MINLKSIERGDVDVYSIIDDKLSIDSSIKDIKKAYRRQALLYHPDKNQDNPNANIEFHYLQKAYELLTNNIPWKQKYDDKIRNNLLKEQLFKEKHIKTQTLLKKLKKKEQAAKLIKIQQEKLSNYQSIQLETNQFLTKFDKILYHQRISSSNHQENSQENSQEDENSQEEATTSTNSTIEEKKIVADLFMLSLDEFNKLEASILLSNANE